MFPISRDPPEGGTLESEGFSDSINLVFPISRDPPEGGTICPLLLRSLSLKFPISRDPPEGGTLRLNVDQSV